MRKRRTAYELARSQVDTPPAIVGIFWRITHRYRSDFSTVLDLGAGDCRFAHGGRYQRYEGVEIDRARRPAAGLPRNARIHHTCAFEYKRAGYSACIGNPPYVRHHDLDEEWRDAIATRLSKEIGLSINRQCNLYIYFLFLALLKTKADGLVSMIVPYEWVSRPAAKPLRDFISAKGWHVDSFRFSDPIFGGVLTTASICVIDKRNRDGKWRYYNITEKGETADLGTVTGTTEGVFSYDKRGPLWAKRGMSPGTQSVFTLTEGERVHGGLRHEDVIPCVTSLRDVPRNMVCLTPEMFRQHFVDAGARCWLIKSNVDPISPRLQAYLRSIPKSKRDTWTCTSRETWYRYVLFDVPGLLVGTGFTSFGPKVLVNSARAHAAGSVCGVYSDSNCRWQDLQAYLTAIDFEKRVIPHAKSLKKIEIRQLNSILNAYKLAEESSA